MVFRKAALAALASIAFCSAQSIEVKGTVKDAAGGPVAGVLVRLEKTGYQTLSGADGSFTLNDKATAILRPGPGLDGRAPQWGGKGGAWAVQRGAARYRLDGRAIFAWATSAASLSIMPVTLVKASAAAPAIATSASAIPSTATPATSTAAAGIPDILFAGKTGFLAYRSAVVTAAPAALEIRLVASAGVLKDADGNEYQTVKLGNQVWLAEHFRSTKYIDGTAIPRVQDKAGWANRATPAFCSYNGMADADSLKRFGLLYNWHTINTKKLAPDGWRVPAEADWTALQNYLIGAGYNFDGTTSGNKIGKAMAGMTDWATAAKAGAIGNDQSKNNKSGFGGVPTGFRDQGGGFTSMGSRCIMSSTATKENTFGYFGDLDAASETLRYSDDWMSMGFLVRLVKN